MTSEGLGGPNTPWQQDRPYVGSLCPLNLEKQAAQRSSPPSNAILLYEVTLAAIHFIFRSIRFPYNSRPIRVARGDHGQRLARLPARPAENFYSTPPIHNDLPNRI